MKSNRSRIWIGLFVVVVLVWLALLTSRSFTSPFPPSGPDACLEDPDHPDYPFCDEP